MVMALRVAASKFDGFFDCESTKFRVRRRHDHDEPSFCPMCHTKINSVTEVTNSLPYRLSWNDQLFRLLTNREMSCPAVGVTQIGHGRNGENNSTAYLYRTIELVPAIPATIIL